MFTRALVIWVIVLGWLATHVAIIGFMSWLQPVTAVVGLAVLVLASWLPPGNRD